MVTKMVQYNTEFTQEDFNSFIERCILPLPANLSQKFHRISKEFNNNINFITNYVY